MSPRGRILPVVALALALFAVHAALLSGFTSDDAYISFRYARNIAAGLGPVYNPGERVEGFSNPLFTFLLAALAPLSGDQLPLVARALGVLSGAASLLLLAWLPAAGGPLATTLALALTATSTSFALWAVGGLETTLYGLLILAGVALTVARPRTGRGQTSLGLLLAAIALSRPEGILPAAALVMARWIDPETRRDRAGHARVIAAAVIPAALYLGFRLSTYGAWVPNTWLAKRLPPAMALHRGLDYLAGFFAANGTWWLYVPGLLVLRAPGRHRAATVALGVIALDLVHVLVTGGDWMDAHRFIAPLVPLVYFVVAEGWIELLGLAAGAIAARGAGWIAAALPPAGALAVWLALLLPNVAHTRHEREAPWVNATPYYTTVGKLVAAVAEPAWTLAVDDIGAIGWHGRIEILDMLGLVSFEVALRKVSVQEVVAREFPELIVLHYDDRPAPTARWRTLKILDFDSLYVTPRGPVPLPGSFLARVDVAPRVAARLESLPAPLVADLRALDGWLRTHQPDGRPVRALAAP